MWNKEKTDGKRQPDPADDLMATNGQIAVVESGSALDGINAFVGKGVDFKGTISYHGTVRIDGTLEGEIHTEGTLLVGEEAVIKAKVTAGTIVCKGQITGDILAKEKVTLRAPAVINGGVETPMLSMEEGVQFNGTIEMSVPARTAKLAGEGMVAAGAYS
jgi:cytoskeletal protein CcmA (bactofilin family)